ncbi:MAG TPA: outer membrane beta-barrel protein [Candidatus Polarisedimenticolia bacterium]|nr:outer membrane beta-barrel protein [Candidatus Polarisedimenticolia bacterium]
MLPKNQSAEVRRFLMRMTWALAFGALLWAASPAETLAAQRTSTAPKEGDMAVSANLGFSSSFDDNFGGVEPLLTGTFEYYSTPRVSWRALLGTTSFDADNPSDAEVDVMFINGNISYNWEQGTVHPYVTGGIGFYNKDADASLPPDADDDELGLNFGGGVDWFLGARWALKFEGTLHILGGDDPDNFILGSVGAKWWF